jgi:LysR family transcriptional regulator, transcriptional activator of nhaA
MKTFGQEGAGLFPSPTAIQTAGRRQYGVEVVVEVQAVAERFYAISVERRIRHPAVAAICAGAGARIFQRDQAKPRRVGLVDR